MKSDDITIPNIFEIKSISPSSSPRGKNYFCRNQKIIKYYKIFAFFKHFYKFFYELCFTFNINMFNVT